ncbi:MAG: peptidylprolyl isomerase [Phycisphaerae bacterium]
MIRFTLFTFSCIVLAQLSPEQCNLTTDPGAPTGPFTPPARQIPTTATASTNQATVGQNVQLAAAITDTGGGPTIFSWVQTAGPGVQLADPFTQNAAFEAPSLGSNATLAFLVAVRNQAGDIGRASVEVSIAADPNFSPFNPGPNNPPDNPNQPSGATANAGADQTVQEASIVTLSASASTGTGLTFAWRQIGGNLVDLMGNDTERPTFIAPVFVNGGLNRLEFELAILDDKGNRDTDTVVIRIAAIGEIPDPDENPRVRIVTSRGNITVELFADDAPETVANFLQYVDDGFYAGTIFHRVIPDFVVQGGGFLTGLVQKDTRDPIDLETDAMLPNDRGTIAMARTNDPNSATSQFFFNLVDNDSLNPDSNPPGYAVFGRVVEGQSVVDGIATIETETTNGFMDVPVIDVTIQRVERVSAN